MASKQYITELRIKNYRQFHHIHFQFCDPSTNEPLEKICFIGSNGTGKSTLLSILSWICRPGFITEYVDWGDEPSLICWQIQLDKNRYFVLKSNRNSGLPDAHLTLPGDVEDSAEWQSLWNGDEKFDQAHPLFDYFSNIAAEFTNLISTQIELKPNSNDLAIHSLPDGVQITGRSPQTNLGNALEIFDNLPAFHLTNSGELIGFWNFLIYQIKRRESNYQTFLNDESTQSLSVAEARKKFDAENPEILEELAKQWNLILEQAGLGFDTKNAKIPVQLNENLEAYIRLKNRDIIVNYNLLSTGIRNFIFRLGHIFALYFNRQIERGFLFLDEPEQSLYPDLLFDVIERYLAIIHNTQFFVATHSEIVASQFKPSERILLQFEDDGSVTWRRGLSPEGDDPNDVLLNDFSVRSLYGKEGIKQWQRYRALRHQIAVTDDPEEKTRLMDEYLKIGTAYNFAPNEIPT